MTSVIHKQIIDIANIPADGHFNIKVPAFANILTIQEQRGNVCVWYRCTPENKEVTRRLSVHGTGDDAPRTSIARYISTVQLFGGDLVLHFFESNT